MPVNEAGIATGKGSATPSNWTPERVAKLLEIWPLGASAKEAAAEIGGVSRNAVIGKVHRLKLPKRPQDMRGKRYIDPEVVARKKQEANRRKSEAKKARRAGERDDAPQDLRAKDGPDESSAVGPYELSLRLQFADLGPGHCLFPEGKEPPFEFCGNPVAGGTSWCRHHQNIVWTPPERRRAVSYDANRRGRKSSPRFGSYEAA